jgi:hypothetical protein
MAIRAWMDGDIRLAVRLLQWATPAAPRGGTDAERSRADLNLQAA